MSTLVNGPLKILFVTAELAPFVKTGGLGDVAEALPAALRRAGHDVRVAMPLYRAFPSYLRGEQVALCTGDFGFRKEFGALRRSLIPATGVPLYLVEHDGYFHREQPYGYDNGAFDDNLERFCFFCLALLDALPHTGWMPDIVHCHDWHTAPIPPYLRTRYSQDPNWGPVPALFTIHNLAYQGRFPASRLPASGLGWELFTPHCLEFHGELNLMKGAIAYATKINTVSRRYAEEIQTPEYGHGLEGFLATRAEDLSGILNGIDTVQWNPETDPLVPAQYSAEDLSGKAVCKSALQRALRLPEREVPLFGIISRLVWQKGLDLVCDVLDAILGLDVQLVVLGTGEPHLEFRFREEAERHPDRLRTLIRFDNRLAHMIEAGSDFFLMPSRFEPSGLNQMYSLRYGAVPIVRRTGGLADTVRDEADATGGAPPNGLVFDEATPEAVMSSIRRAVALYQAPGALDTLRRVGMKEDFSWERSSRAYVALYREAIAAACPTSV